LGSEAESRGGGEKKGAHEGENVWLDEQPAARHRGPPPLGRIKKVKKKKNLLAISLRREIKKSYQIRPPRTKQV